MKRRSVRELRDAARRGRRRGARRRRPASSSTAVAPAACTGLGGDPSVTELAAGLRALRPDPLRRLRRASPAAGRLLRRSRSCAGPAPGIATAFGGGYVASGPPGWSRVPVAAAPSGPAAGAHRGRRRGADARCEGAGADRLQLGRPGMVPARQGGRAARAVRRSAPRRRGGASSSGRAATYRGEGQELRVSEWRNCGRAQRRVVQLGRHRVASSRASRRRAARPRSSTRSRRARRRGLRVKAVGAGHSFTGVAVDRRRAAAPRPAERRARRSTATRGRVHRAAPAPRCTCSTRRSRRSGWRCPTSATSTGRPSPARSRTGTHGTGARLGGLAAAGPRRSSWCSPTASVVDLLGRRASPSCSPPPGSGSARSASSPRSRCSACRPSCCTPSRRPMPLDEVLDGFDDAGRRPTTTSSSTGSRTPTGC